MIIHKTSCQTNRKTPSTKWKHSKPIPCVSSNDKKTKSTWLTHDDTVLFFFFLNHPIAPDSTDGREVYWLGHVCCTRQFIQDSVPPARGLGWGKGRAGIANCYYLLQPSMGLSGPDRPYEIPVVMTLAQNTPNRLRKRSRKARTGKSMTAPIATCRHGEGDENFAEDIHAKNPDNAGALTLSIWRLKPDILSNKSWQRNLMRFSWETNKIEKLPQNFLLFMSFWQKLMRISAGILWTLWMRFWWFYEVLTNYPWSQSLVLKLNSNSLYLHKLPPGQFHVHAFKWINDLTGHKIVIGMVTRRGRDRELGRPLGQLLRRHIIWIAGLYTLGVQLFPGKQGESGSSTDWSFRLS